MILKTWTVLCLTTGLALALAPAPRQTMEESLRSALDAISRKQSSLDGNSQDYYNDLRGLKYHGDDGEKKFDRERQAERELDDEDEEIEFLPSEVGQLETVGNGYQDLNNKVLKRVLIAYLHSIPQQDEPVKSLFRERERSSNRKRDSESDRFNLDNKELAKLYMLIKELQKDSPYTIENAEEERYLDLPQIIYDPYRGDRENKLSASSGPMSWGESMVRGQGREADENDYGDREQDPNRLYMSMGDPRNVNGGYSVGTQRPYRTMAKRYPIAKRSPKPMPTKKEVTDPKVVQDLGALFGTQATSNQNRTHIHDHDHSHDHDHTHDHDHSHDHDQDHSHDHDQDHSHDHGDRHKHESSSEAPNSVTSSSKGQKENTGKSIKTKSIEVRKKSVDWSQYFGIDRRRKKDLEEVHGRYVDSEDGMDLQRVQRIKDIVMARLAAAYSLENMGKPLNELRNSIAAMIEAQKAAHRQSNQTSSFRENNAKNLKDKRMNGNNLQLVENENAEENRVCPELEMIENWCRLGEIAGDESEMLHLPCVMLQICKACVKDELVQECFFNYGVEAGKVCDAQEMREGPKGREACVRMSMFITQLQVPPMISEQCRIDGNDSCLRYHLYRYWHRYPRYPYSGRRPGNYDAIDPQQSDR